MRKALIAALAQYAGQELTKENGIAIVNALFPQNPIDISQFAPMAYGNLVFQAERFADILDEIHPVHVSHFEETERAREGIEFDPDIETRLEAEASGNLIQFTIRDGSELVGNIRFFLYQDTHAKSVLCAKEDTYFIKPSHRKGFLAIRFWQYAEQCIADLGVWDVRTDTKIQHDADGNEIRNVGRLNEYLKYAHVSNGYYKIIGKRKPHVQF